MTPTERLKEIEESAIGFKGTITGDKFEWLINRVHRLTKALEFYADQSNWEDTYMEFDSPGGQDGDVSRLIDLEDIEIEKDSEGEITMSCGGKRARKALEEE